MSPRTPQQFEQIRQDRKAKIFDSALHLFAEEGFHASSISKIAKHAGISKGLIYNYFESKDDLLKQLMFDVMDRTLTSLGIEGKTELKKEDFIELVDTSLDLVLEDIQHWKLYFAVVTQPYVLEHFMAEMLERIQPSIALYMDYFQKISGEDPIVMMRYFTAVMDGVQMHILLDPDNFPVKSVRNMIVKQFT